MTEAPKAVQKAITKFGGKNSYGQPLWRIVLAQDQLVKRGGVHMKWPTGEIKTCGFEKIPDGKGGYVYRQVPIEQHPESVTYGVLEVPKYPVRGWVLERWFPPHVFGSKDDWMSAKAVDGLTPLFGEFPSRGDYFMVVGPLDELPELSDIENAIAMWEKQMSLRPTNTQAWFERELKEQRDAEEAAYEKMVAELTQYAKSEITPIFNTISTGAQAVRNEVQKSLGNQSHLGAGQ